jgi:hypothetical protein
MVSAACARGSATRWASFFTMPNNEIALVKDNKKAAHGRF